MKDRNNIIEIEILFNDNKRVEFKSNEKWPIYYQSETTKMPYGSNIKDDFPCTYLSANRDLAKNMQFRSYELMGKIAKAFNDKIEGQTKTKLKTKFDEIMNILDTIE